MGLEIINHHLEFFGAQVSRFLGDKKVAPLTRLRRLFKWFLDYFGETGFTRGGGASVGKPNPGGLSFEHYYDSASPAIMAYICMGKSFDTIKLHMCKTTGSQKPEPFFMAVLTDAFITKVNCKATDNGDVIQTVEMVFKQIEIDYKPQSGTVKADGTILTGGLGPPINYKWNITAGTASGGSLGLISPAACAAVIQAPSRSLTVTTRSR